MSHVLNDDEVADTVRIHVREAAEKAAQSHPESRKEACMSVAREFFRMLDGGNPLLPKFSLMTVPHPEDKKFLEKTNRPWYPEDLIAEGYLERFESGEHKKTGEVQECRVLTSLEAQDILIRHVEDLANYWADNLRSGDVPDACSGTGFSIFAALDGTSMNIPGIDLLYEDTSGVNIARQEAGLRPFPEMGVISTELHGSYYQAEVPAPAIKNGGNKFS